MFYECVTGRVPFDKPSPGEVMKAHVRDEPPSLRVERGEIPAALDPALARGLAKDRDDRYPNCLALVDALEAALQRPDGSSADETKLAGPPDAVRSSRGGRSPETQQGGLGVMTREIPARGSRARRAGPAPESSPP